MKKLLTLLLSILMIISLVGCNTNEPTTSNNEEEPTTNIDEPLVGGYTEVEDKNLTPELIEMFEKALEGLMGASYTPVYLDSTQVVAGTNYKFKADGSKTTNPIIMGSYYVYINKDLEGNISLLDIETIEEHEVKEFEPEIKIDTKIKDTSKYNYWIVFYDQYGNELQREAKKLGTTPEYKGNLPQGFISWDKELKPITTNTYIHAVCNSVSSNTNSPSSLCAYTGDLCYVVGGPYIGSYDFYKFTYNGNKFVFNGNPLDPLNNQPSGDPVVVGHWYHDVDGQMVECEDPDHHGVYIPKTIYDLMETTGNVTEFNFVNSFSGKACVYDEGNLKFTNAGNDKYITISTYLEKSGDNWIYDDADVTITFAMSSGVLAQIYVNHKCIDWEAYWGFYLQAQN